MDYTKEVADGGATFYSNLNGHDSAVFIPDKYHLDPAINVLLYFHGNADRPDLRQYINGPNRRPIRKAVGDDGRFALVIPWIGSNSDALYIVGGVTTLDAYLDTVCASLMPGTGTPSTPSNLHLIIAAHSGGGRALTATMRMNSSRYASKIISAWALDCFYTSGTSTAAEPTMSADWISWAKADPNRSLYIYYTGGTPMLNSKPILSAGLSNVHGGPSRVVHDETPKEYFPELLKAIP